MVNIGEVLLGFNSSNRKNASGILQDGKFLIKDQES